MEQIGEVKDVDRNSFPIFYEKIGGERSWSRGLESVVFVQSLNSGGCSSQI